MPAIIGARSRCRHGCVRNGPTMRFATFEYGGIETQLRGLRRARAIRSSICLHGFPEYWAAWSAVMLELCRFATIWWRRTSVASICRSKPQGVEAYRAHKITGQDLAALADHLVARAALHPGRPRLGRLDRLRLRLRAPGAADASDRRQRRPSRVRSSARSSTIRRSAGQPIHQPAPQMPTAAKLALGQWFRGHVRAARRFSDTGWMRKAQHSAYCEAWSAARARMEAMLDWYRASPLVVPEIRRDRVRPRRSSSCRRTLLPGRVARIWWCGARRIARLLPACLDGLEAVRAEADGPQTRRLRALAAAREAGRGGAARSGHFGDADVQAVATRRALHRQLIAFSNPVPCQLLLALRRQRADIGGGHRDPLAQRLVVERVGGDHDVALHLAAGEIHAAGAGRGERLRFLLRRRPAPAVRRPSSCRPACCR